MLPSAASNPRERLNYNAKNLTILGSLFNWLCVDEINQSSVHAMAERFGLPLPMKDFRIELRWKLYDQYHIFDNKRRQLFHIKRVWEQNYLREVLALHLATRVFDPELFVPNYLTGTYVGGWKKWKMPVPYIMTPFLQGKTVKMDFKRDPQSPLWMWFGRHHYLHVLLSLYDVEPRHFMVVEDRTVVKRLDLGLAFTKLDQKYDGFQAIFGDAAFEQNPAFQEGVAFEREGIQNNLQTNRPALISILQEFSQLEEDSIVDFNPVHFYQELKTYWRRWVPELDLGKE